MENKKTIKDFIQEYKKIKEQRKEQEKQDLENYGKWLWRGFYYQKQFPPKWNHRSMRSALEEFFSEEIKWWEDQLKIQKRKNKKNKERFKLIENEINKQIKIAKDELEYLYRA